MLVCQASAEASVTLDIIAKELKTVKHCDKCIMYVSLQFKAFHHSFLLMTTYYIGNNVLFVCILEEWALTLVGLI